MDNDPREVSRSGGTAAGRQRDERDGGENALSIAKLYAGTSRTTPDAVARGLDEYYAGIGELPGLPTTKPSGLRPKPWSISPAGPGALTGDRWSWRPTASSEPPSDTAAAAGDPHLHTHVLIAIPASPARIAVGRRSTAGRLFAWSKPVGHLYEAKLRAELSRHLGIERGPVRKRTPTSRPCPAR